MEAYFHNDPRIREWVDQITENIFTVCLLTGVDSDAEFQSGCQIVMKIVSLLKEIPTIPSEFLADVVKQLLEQVLPDTRVIDNFPAYKATMDRMLCEGILMAMDMQNKGAITSLVSSEENAEKLRLELFDNNTGIRGEESIEEFITESVIPALATVATVEVENDTNMADTKLDADAVKPEPLKRVLSNIFPNSIVYWNKNLMEHTFLAQVEDILICLDNPEHSFSLKNFYKEGWKVIVCSVEDLMFPRRLEREIRRVQRSGKKCSLV